MPRCHNDVTRRYVGNEPSPKGNGICAHAEPLGDTREGLDKQWWTVIETKNGVKRWVRGKKSLDGRRTWVNKSPSRTPRRRSKKKTSSPRQLKKKGSWKKTDRSRSKSRSPKRKRSIKSSHPKKCGDDPRPRHKNSPPYSARHCAEQERTGRDGLPWVSVRAGMRKGSVYYAWRPK